MSKNEKKTENISRRLLTKAGIFDNDDFIVDRRDYFKTEAIAPVSFY